MRAIRNLKPLFLKLTVMNVHKYIGLKTQNFRDFKVLTKEIRLSNLPIIDKVYLRFVDVKIIYIFSLGNV